MKNATITIEWQFTENDSGDGAVGPGSDASELNS